jgi:hypothetical protein
MNTFKRKALVAAVLAGVGVAGTAEAVYLNPNKTGQVLIYPYYTVQQAQGASWNTYLSVVNTTSAAKAVKVRVIEGKTSAEVLDFNLYLSPNDVWTAAIVPSDATTGASGRIITADASCTSPGNIGLAGQDFRNYQYLPTTVGGGGAHLPGTGLDRTREGYVEIIEMGILTGTWANAVTHNSAGVPNNCAVVTPSTASPVGLNEISAPTGGLMGTGTLINVTNGQDAGYKADALEAWSNVQQYSVPSLTTPNLGSASPAVSLVINAGGLNATSASMAATAYLTSFGAAALSGVPAGARAVASVYMHSAVMNEYVLDTTTQSNTDWVVTQPLKNLFVSSATAATPYTAVLTSSGACETVSFTYFNREERGATAAASDFSPPPPDLSPVNSLCWEANVISIRNGATHMPSGNVSGVLGSMNVTNINVTSGFQNGWAIMSFTGTNATLPAGMAGAAPTSSQVVLDQSTVAAAPITFTGAATFFGLPVTGFMVRNFRNGTLTCGTGNCQGNYGSLFSHSYRNLIRP